MSIEILLLLILITQSMRNAKNTPLHSLNSYIENMEVDLNYTEQKINLIKKIAPLLPLEYMHPLNRSVMITESVVKLLELKDYMDESRYVIDQSQIIPIKDNQERINRIISIIQEEVPKSNMGNMGMLMNVIVNMEQYKKMLMAFNTFMSNQDALKEPENIIKLMEPLMAGKGNREGSKDMEQMMNIIKVLASSENKDKDENTL